MTTSSIVFRAASLMDILADRSAPMALADLAKVSGFPKSSVHRVMSILVTERMAAYDGDAQRYTIGPRSLGWGASMLRARNLPDHAGPVMDALSADCAAPVAMGQLDGPHVIYTKSVANSSSVRFAPRVGERSPAHACAVGKALLAWMPEPRQDAFLNGTQMEWCTQYTVNEPGDLKQDLGGAKVRGYAECDREEFLQISGIAAPILDMNGDAIAAVSIWDQGDAGVIGHLRYLAPRLLQACDRISRQIGYQAG